LVDHVPAFRIPVTRTRADNSLERFHIHLPLVTSDHPSSPEQIY
jgi:hypothetical protein